MSLQSWRGGGELMKRPPGGGKRSHWEGGPQQPRCARTLQGILQFTRK